MKKLNTMAMTAVIVGIMIGSASALAAEPIVSEEAKGNPIHIPAEKVETPEGDVAIILYDCGGGFLAADCGETIS